MKMLIMLLAICALPAQANTFVGNGGGAGDVELSVTRKQIAEAFRVVFKRVDDDSANWCRCYHAYQNARSATMCGLLRMQNANSVPRS